MSNDDRLSKLFAETNSEKDNKKKEKPKITETKPIIEETEDTTTTEQQRELWVGIFGRGYSDTEYRDMYDIFSSLANNYQLQTAFHTEALATYVKYAYRRNIAIASGDADGAKIWGMLAKDQADKAKINPNQLSAADLSDGMTSFSQLSATVEKAQDIIPLLPSFREEPKDRVDYTLWEYINYIMHFLGKPLVPYKDIYNFLDERYESLKKRYKFLKLDELEDFDNNDIDNGV